MAPVKRILRNAAGWLFLILGILGLFLPILQGFLFIFVGILLLSPDIPLFKRLVKWLGKRYPRLARQASKIVDGLE